MIQYQLKSTNLWGRLKHTSKKALKVLSCLQEITTSLFISFYAYKCYQILSEVQEVKMNEPKRPLIAVLLVRN